MGETIKLNLFECARCCIDAAGVEEKLRLTRRCARAWREGHIDSTATAGPDPIAAPGRPVRPVLVHPSRVKPRKLATRQGMASFLHALAHIEFNAINLAWDAVYRFRGMPAEFYTDWIRVADEEAHHFSLLNQRLEDLGQAYGDFPAHDGLWHMARETAHDILVRMALVPRVLEARGLDVTPAMIVRLQQAGDAESAAVLETILHDEIGHVQAGTHWFQYVCRQRDLDPLETFRSLLAEYAPGRIRAPFNTGARQQAGFGSDEMVLLEELARSRR
ncbi:MAG: ferritin-like domain-containing protein [Gammaproteobacteria bacterium]